MFFDQSVFSSIVLSLMIRYVEVFVKIRAISNFRVALTFQILHLIVSLARSTNVLVIDKFDNDLVDFIDENTIAMRNRLTVINLSNLVHECRYLMINSI